MVNHIVMFSLNGSDEERKALASEFSAALSALPEKIKELRSIEVHLNENPCENYDLMLHARLLSREDLVAYSLHPAHLEAVAIIKQAIAGRACIDYKTPDEDETQH